jgi:hypothetical protein
MRRGCGMRCTVCGGTRFVATEYKTGEVTAPAMECASCSAIVLEEGVARTEEERSSVKIAIALRAAVQDASPTEPALDDADEVTAH